MKSDCRILFSRTLWTSLVLVGLALPALAALGGDVTSVHEDQAQMKGSLKTTQAAAYTVHEITAPEGTTVREYVSPEGTVFGVVWQGRAMPNFQQILGSYFQKFSEAAQSQKAARRGRGNPESKAAAR